MSKSVYDTRARVWFVNDGPELDVLGEALSASSERGDIGRDGGRFERHSITLGRELISATFKTGKCKATAEIGKRFVNRTTVESELDANRIVWLCSRRRDHFSFQDASTLRKN